MIEEAKLSALLHVSAVLTVLTLAFLGLDSPDITKPDYTKGMAAAQPKAKAVLLRLGLSGSVAIKIFGAGWWFRIRTTVLAAVICLIADDPVKLGMVLHSVHICHRQKHIPLWDYFKRSNHQLNVAVVAAFSAFVFFSTAAAIVWNHNWFIIDQGWFEPFSEGWLVKALVIAEALCLVWLVVTGACMRWLSADELNAKCDELEKEITEHFNYAKKKQRQKLKRDRAKVKDRRDRFIRVAENAKSFAERAQKAAAAAQDELDKMGDD